jgi:Uma2 family endonuclease
MRMPADHLVTAEDLERMGERGRWLELVHGELVAVNPPGGEHGALAALLAAELITHVNPRGLGRVYVESGFVLLRNPDTVRGPDVSFVSRERDAHFPSRQGFLPGAPDLAIEIWSPDNTMAELARRAAEYLDAGAQQVWIVDPRSRAVTVHAPGRAVAVLTAGDTLDGGDVLPGFSLSILRLFAALD